MKSWLTIITAVIKLLFMSINAFTENSKEKKAKKKEAIGMVKEGIKNNDPSLITAGFDKVNNV